MKQIIHAEKAPGAIGPYSQAVKAGGFLYTSGQLGLDGATGALMPDVESQTEQALRNVGEILTAAGASFDSVVKTTVFLADMNDFAQVNAVYTRFFDGSAGYPARSCVQVAKLPKNALVEIECVAICE